MSSEKNLFEYLESSMSDIELPEMPYENMDYIVEKSIDPIVGAKTIQLYAETQSPEAQDHLIRKFGSYLNYLFMAEYMNSPTRITVTENYTAADTVHAKDLKGFHDELADKNEVKAGGKMGWFENHYYTDPATSITRPIFSLRLHSAAYICDNGDGGTLVGIPNYLTVPVTSIDEYIIEDRR